MEKEQEENKPDVKDTGSEEILDFTKPDFAFIPKGVHEWRQQGPYCICKSCELEHAVYIGMEHIMVGISENGMPILEKRVVG